MSAPVPDPAANAAQADGIGEAAESAECSGTAAIVEDDASENSRRADRDRSDADAAGEDPAGLADVAERAALAEQLEAMTAERDEYLDQLQRQRAEFRNFRRRSESERHQQIAAGVSRLVESLLPVLDGCDAAALQGHTEVAAVGQALMVALEKAGLERIDAIGESFDPTQHEAVTVEHAPEAPDERSDAVAETSPDAVAETSPDAVDAPAGEASSHDSGDCRQIVTAELRSGFRFDGRVLRAAMVRVRTA